MRYKALTWLADLHQSTWEMHLRCLTCVLHYPTYIYTERWEEVYIPGLIVDLHVCDSSGPPLPPSERATLHWNLNVNVWKAVGGCNCTLWKLWVTIHFKYVMEPLRLPKVSHGPWLEISYTCCQSVLKILRTGLEWLPQFLSFCPPLCVFQPLREGDILADVNAYL